MSYLLKVIKNTKNIKEYTPDGLVEETSEFVNSVIYHAENDNIEGVLFIFYKMAHFSQAAFLHKNTSPKDIESARDYADAYEYFIESLKEVSAMVEAMLKEKFKGLLPNGIAQTIVTYASEEKKLTNKKIKKHITSLLPKPRKATRDRRGASHANN